MRSRFQHRWLLNGFAVALAASLAAPSTAAQRTEPEFWFCPGPGTLDYLRLFERPAEWEHARQIVDVFKFYQGHTQTPTPTIMGPDSYEALARVGAFRQLRQWNIKTSIEVGAVKEFWCTPDERGMNEAIAESLRSIQRIEEAGGKVASLSMDEPWVSGAARVCGGPALEPTADRVATYMAGVHAVYPSVEIGLIEAYPFSGVDKIVSILSLLKARNALPAFLHMDVDWHLSGRAAFIRDMPRLKQEAHAAGMRFGVIITGYNGDADALYAVDVGGITGLTTASFPGWEQMPDHIVIQSWVESSTGLRITPSNLPEDRTYTHTNLISNVFRRLRGATGEIIGPAIRRR